MNAVMMHTKNRLIDSGKQYPGTWLLAVLDLALILGLWAAVAYSAPAPRPVAASQTVPARLITASNAQSVRAHPNLGRLALPANTTAARHGAACDQSPASCGALDFRFIDPPSACQPVSRAAQHRNGDLDNPNPCLPGQ
jgi:hypothetical protein